MEVYGGVGCTEKANLNIADRGSQFEEVKV
jgi:hypothetical protein